MVKHQKLIHTNASFNESTPNSVPVTRPPSQLPMSPLVAQPELRIRPINQPQTYFTALQQRSQTTDSELNGIFVRTDIPTIESILGEIKSKSIRFTATGIVQ